MKRHRAPYDAKRDLGILGFEGKPNAWWLGQQHLLGGLLRKLQAYRVDWKFSFVPTENVEYEPGIDRGKVELDDPTANVISSELKNLPGHHVVALDIDHHAWLVPSSTEGHSHLYIDKTMPWEQYEKLLDVLAECGIIEPGYAQVSKARGHSDLRLPWVSKDDQETHPKDGIDVPKPQSAPRPTSWDEMIESSPF